MKEDEGVGHVARMRGKKNIYGKNQLEDLDVDGNIILKWVFR